MLLVPNLYFFLKIHLIFYQYFSIRIKFWITSLFHNLQFNTLKVFELFKKYCNIQFKKLNYIYQLIIKLISFIQIYLLNVEKRII